MYEVPLFFKDALTFMEIYAYKIDSFITLINVCHIFGGVPWFALIYLNAFKNYRPHTFVGLCFLQMERSILVLTKIN
jgi:hypothetical protein